MSSKSQLLADSFAWFGNVSTSVAIIFVNKVLMNVSGYGFRYGARARAPNKVPAPEDLSLLSIAEHYRAAGVLCPCACDAARSPAANLCAASINWLRHRSSVVITA